MRRAKIVCTLGPSSLSQERLEQLLNAGMDVARLNFSHGTHQQHAESIEKLRAASLKVRKAVGLLADLQGPKIRTGRVEKGMELKEGARLIITTDETVIGKGEMVSTTYQHLPMDVNPGDRILLDDGLLELKVRTTDKKGLVETEVITGGPLKSNKGINLPGIALHGEALTPKDLADLAFAVKSGIDYLGLSFVRQPGDIDQARAEMERAGRQVPIIAKLEKPEALARLDAILDKTDGVMIATQMLESMIINPRPTRAEASDVANAVFDGADAVMLSGETASGKYPVESVQMMERIILAAESSARQQPWETPEPATIPASFPDTTCSIACRAAQETGASVIACFTVSGTTARLLSRYRPRVPIIAFTPNQEVRRRMSLFWGVLPRVLEPIQETEAMVKRVEEELLSRSLVHKGDRIVIVFGAPVGQPGKINSVRLHQVAS